MNKILNIEIENQQSIIKIEEIIKSSLEQVIEAERQRIQKLITDEIATAHLEGQSTSRLTSLFNRVNI